MEMSIAQVNNTQESVIGPRQEDILELSALVADRLFYFRRIAMRQLGDVHDAEDAVQDALLSAYKNLAQFRGQAQMATWLTTIVLNSARMKARRRLRPPHIPIDDYDREHEYHPLSDKLSDCRPDPEALFRAREFRDNVKRLSERLSPVLRETFQLRAMDELNTHETARALGVRETAVKARASRARAHLRRMLQKGYGTCPTQ